MANTQRREFSPNGQMFIPMNVEGRGWNEKWFTTTKAVTIAIILASLIVFCVALKNNQAPLFNWLLVLSLWLVGTFYATRFIIFEERKYYAMYKNLKAQEITTPACFWNIASIREDPAGAIMTYNDGKVGVIIKMERDTVACKPRDFMETHYDALSDFYNALMRARYKVVQMNIMEPAGNDPRLSELDKLVVKTDNESLRKLMSLMVGYTKSNTRRILYESEYFLIYTDDTTRVDQIIADVEEYGFILLNGAFLGFKVLDRPDILNMIKDNFGVAYFDSNQATLKMFKTNGVNIQTPFEISGVTLGGRNYELTKATEQVIKTLTSKVESRALDVDSINILDEVIAKEPKYANMVRFSGNQTNRPNQPIHTGHSPQLQKTPKRGTPLNSNNQVVNHPNKPLNNPVQQPNQFKRTDAQEQRIRAQAINDTRQYNSNNIKGIDYDDGDDEVLDF